jgi:hypothetical protein
MRIEIRQRKNISTEAMDKNGVMIKNTYPGAVAGSTIRKNIYGWTTGLSEEDTKKYGDLLGLDLSKKSDYWENFFIDLSSRKNEYIILNTENPKDYITYNAAIASGIVAPDRASLNEETFLNTNYYFFKIEEEQQKKKDLSKRRNKLLGKLANHDESKEWLLFINYALGLYISKNIKVDRLYNQINDRLSRVTNEKEIKIVSDIFDKTPLQLQSEFVVEKAIDNKLITYDSVDRVYNYNGNKWGMTKDLVISKISDPQYSEDLSKLSGLILNDYI